MTFPNRMSKRFLVLMVTLILVAAGLVVIVVLRGGTGSGPAMERYKAAKRMVRDEVLVGKTPEQLTEIMGQPEIRHSPGGRWSMGWYLGEIPSGAPVFFPYSKYLVVVIRDGVVVRAMIIDLD